MKAGVSQSLSVDYYSRYLLADVYENTPTVKEKVLIFGCSGDADKLDPADVTDGESTARTDSIFEGLVEYKAGTTEIQPCLATSWNISADGKNITFHFETGREVPRWD